MYLYSRIIFVTACLIGALSILAAAYIAHLPELDAHALRSLNSALQMLQFHTLALVLVSWIAKDTSFNKALVLSGILFAVGILFFSVNIMLHQFLGIEIFRPLTPYGGMAFFFGWLALGAFRFVGID
jgi:hypothetical protein